jgi:hypothetical protein
MMGFCGQAVLGFTFTKLIREPAGRSGTTLGG